MHHYAALDDQRLEDLIQRWLPVATGPAPEIEKVGRNGHSFIELDTETPVKAAAIVLYTVRTVASATILERVCRLKRPSVGVSSVVSITSEEAPIFRARARRT
jgi:hypothetical protein